MNKFEKQFGNTPTELLPDAYTKTRTIMEQGKIDGKSAEEIYKEVMEWARYYQSRITNIEE